uniref:Sushi domain-containing protein n=1 Tax=Chromera velia CCMP2878 TaxID=1169474 RepID=A0A0G4G7I1_9ALVE|eukprot:Cvel_20586.t1-p1 / transcript=Cvel_20586.t1 / gene=Cvel_20586 / organism=Chromera_velia_CCMP2878 / gene_product=Complement factor H, putative / transcript_product=Complement factor H, putative / location=Cvel_scaffold1860:2569-18999(+) / protein_length=2548 / sequence_SO=supercontig / SO=protein_coding / is_pseudo=false
MTKRGQQFGTPLSNNTGQSLPIPASNFLEKMLEEEGGPQRLSMETTSDGEVIPVVGDAFVESSSFMEKSQATVGSDVPWSLPEQYSSDSAQNFQRAMDSGEVTLWKSDHGEAAVLVDSPQGLHAPKFAGDGIMFGNLSSLISEGDREYSSTNSGFQIHLALRPHLKYGVKGEAKSGPLSYASTAGQIMKDSLLFSMNLKLPGEEPPGRNLQVETCFSDEDQTLISLWFRHRDTDKLKGWTVDYFKNGNHLPLGSSGKHSRPIPAHVPPGQALIKMVPGSTDRPSGPFELGCGPLITDPSKTSKGMRDKYCFDGVIGFLKLEKEGKAIPEQMTQTSRTLLSKYIGIPSGKVCGDGMKTGEEECDDGNANDDDGCSCNCLKECPKYFVPDPRKPDQPDPGYIVKGEETGHSHFAWRNVSCNLDGGYHPEGTVETSAFVECTTEAEFSGLTLQCKKECPDPNEEGALPVDVKATLQEIKWNSKEPPRHGDSLKVKCLPGTADWAGRMDQTILCADGEWQVPDLVCEAKCPGGKTPPPGFVDKNIQVDIEASHSTMKDFPGDSFYLGCDNNKNKWSALSHHDGMEVVCRDGKWSQDLSSTATLDLECFGGCSRYKLPSVNYDAELILKDGKSGGVAYENTTSKEWFVGPQESNVTVTHGAVVKLKCRKGGGTDYFVASGTEPEELMCNDGHWQERTLTCEPECPEFKVLEPHRAYNVTASSETHGHQASRRIECAEGYSRITEHSAQTLTCQHGVWEPQTLMCYKTCVSYTPPRDEAYAVEYGLDQHTVSCKEGYSSRFGPDTQKVQCLDGEWTPLTLDCQKDCGEFGNQQLLNIGGNLQFQEGSDTTSVKHGAVRTIECQDGFPSTNPMVQVEEMTCFNGEWGEITIQCRMECGVPTLPNNTIAGGAGLLAGSERNVSCDETFRPVAGKEGEKIVCANGAFTKSTLVCESGCGPFPELGHVYQVEGEGRLIGDVRKLSCAQGFDPFAGAPATQDVQCTASGWDAIQVKCGAHCPAEFNPGEAYMVEDFGIASHSNMEGAKRYVRCANGYAPATEDMEQPANVVCTGPSSGTQGFWSPLELQCLKICPEYGPLRDAFKVSMKGLKSGSRRKVECEPGFHDVQGATAAFVDCLDGSWTRLELDCRKDCADEVKVDETVYEVNPPEDPAKNTLLHGAQRRLTCKEGIPPAGVDDEYPVMCNDGEWSHANFICKPECPTPVWPDDHKYTWTEPTGKKHGDTMTVSCKDGYAPHIGTEPDTLICADGKWSGQRLECEEICTGSLELAEKHHIKFKAGNENVTEVSHGSRHEITCADGYYSHSASESEDIVCIQGQFSPPTIMCLPACPAFNLNETAFMNLTDRYVLDPHPSQYFDGSDVFLSGDSVTVSCAPGSRSAQGQGDSQLIGCVHGKWEPMMLICGHDCGEYPDLGEAYQYLKPSGEHGNKFQISCTPGYEPMEAEKVEEEIICWDGNYTAKSIECFPSCPDITEWLAANEYLEGLHALREPQYGHGAQVTISCKQNYSSLDGSEGRQEDLRCINGSWSAPMMRCSKDCSDPVGDVYPADEEGMYDVVGEGLEYGKERKISCRHPYVVQIPDGESDAILEDLAGGDSDKPMADQLFDARQQMVDVIKCERGGVWRRRTIKCDKTCPPFKLDMSAEEKKAYITLPKEPTNMPGQRVVIACNEEDGYLNVTREARQELFCSGGRWTERTIECRKGCNAYQAPSTGFLVHQPLLFPRINNGDFDEHRSYALQHGFRVNASTLVNATANATAENRTTTTTTVAADADGDGDADDDGDGEGEGDTDEGDGTDETAASFIEKQQRQLSKKNKRRSRKQKQKEDPLPEGDPPTDDPAEPGEEGDQPDPSDPKMDAPLDPMDLDDGDEEGDGPPPSGPVIPTVDHTKPKEAPVAAGSEAASSGLAPLHPHGTRITIECADQVDGWRHSPLTTHSYSQEVVCVDGDFTNLYLHCSMNCGEFKLPMWKEKSSSAGFMQGMMEDEESKPGLPEGIMGETTKAMLGLGAFVETGSRVVRKLGQDPADAAAETTTTTTTPSSSEGDADDELDADGAVGVDSSTLSDENSMATQGEAPKKPRSGVATSTQVKEIEAESAYVVKSYSPWGGNDDDVQGSSKWVACNPGFAPEANMEEMEVVCFRSQWTPMPEAIPLHCKPMCEEMHLPHEFPERYEVIDVDFNTTEKAFNANGTEIGTIKHGTTRTVKCAEGFVPTRGITPEMVKCYEGHWTHLSLRCAPMISVEWTHAMKFVWTALRNATMAKTIDEWSAVSVWHPDGYANFYSPLADVANPRSPRPISEPSPLFSGADLVRPTKFEEMWDSKGLNEDSLMDAVFYQMSTDVPADYICLGDAVARYDPDELDTIKPKPNAEDYFCLPSHCVEDCAVGTCGTGEQRDKDTGMDANGGKAERRQFFRDEEWTEKEKRSLGRDVSLWSEAHFFAFRTVHGHNEPLSGPAAKLHRIKWECVASCPGRTMEEMDTGTAEFEIFKKAMMDWSKGYCRCDSYGCMDQRELDYLSMVVQKNDLGKDMSNMFSNYGKPEPATEA